MNGRRQSLTAPGGGGGGGAVTSVAGRTGAVTLTKVDVGLANVDNTADASKPVSTAQAAANAAAQAAAEATAATALSAHASLTSSVHGISTFASTFLDDANAAAVRATIGSIGGTLGATDNALTRADGTGGATAQGSGVTLDDSANLSAINWSISTAVFSGRNYARVAALAANSSLILSPSGTGYISLQVPDGLFTGGNNRGNGAVDLTMDRQLASQVASGASSFAAGRRATASTDTAIAMGDQPSATGSAAVAIGYFPFATGAYSVAVGSCTSSAGFSTSFGYYSLSNLYGMVAEASGRFAATGDAQRGRITARQATTNATPTNLFLDGSSARWIVPANSSGTALVKVVARTATAGGATMTWWRRVNWQRGVAVGTVTIDVETIGTDRGYTGGAWGAGPAWTISITADTTNGGINIIGTGVAATNIRWFADAQWGEDTFA